jgi:hypothetical protein
VCESSSRQKTGGDLRQVCERCVKVMADQVDNKEPLSPTTDGPGSPTDPVNLDQVVAAVEHHRDSSSGSEYEAAEIIGADLKDVDVDADVKAAALEAAGGELKLQTDESIAPGGEATLHSGKFLGAPFTKQPSQDEDTGLKFDFSFFPNK